MDTLCEIRNHIAYLTLNRPAALNALSIQMIEELRGLLQMFIGDDGVHAVAIRGAGDKAFCAGGDIRAIYNSYQQAEANRLYLDFFAAEYPLDYLLRFYPKPYVAMINGIVMGGGMGVAQGSRLRIVGERTRMAMPEVGIGFFPDVGASYFLSRLPGKVGLYLALTGAQIRAADSLYAGLADYYLAPAAMALLETQLAQLEWSGSQKESCMSDLSALIQGLASHPGEPPLLALRDIIDQHFSADNIPALLASLRRETRPEHKAWAQDTLKLLDSRSPTMLAVALQQLKRGRGLSFADCLRMEIGMARQCFEQGDFMEGVRALVIDKDNAPCWRPARIEDVTEAAVEFIFKSPWENASHPLAHLEGEVTHAAQ